LITTHRRGYAARWADRAHYKPIVLDVLAPSDVEAMVKRLLATDLVPPEFVRVVREKAEGNPLFLEEITTSLKERGLLVLRNGELSWASEAVVEFPGSVRTSSARASTDSRTPSSARSRPRPSSAVSLA
jgi:predicted ATPase